MKTLLLLIALLFTGTNAGPSPTSNQDNDPVKLKQEIAFYRSNIRIRMDILMLNYKRDLIKNKSLPLHKHN